MAYPWLAGVCEFYANWAAVGDDGLYHFAPANANETWWKVGDTMSDLCAVRVLFPELIALAARYGQDALLADRCQAILARLPDLPLGRWRVEGNGTESHIQIDRSADVYAPARDPLVETRKHNIENPECYVIFPWSLAGIDSANHERALRTFQARAHANSAGWSQCGVQAARLGLRDQAAQMILDHARRHQSHPYGGWNSPGSMPYRLPDGTRLCDCAYLDAAGENATAIQEMLLQSYALHSPDDAETPGDGIAYGVMQGGIIRLCPALPSRWSGSFRLHAMGGFVVSCDVAGGAPVSVAVTSERSNTCRMASPWPGETLLESGQGRTVLAPAAILAFATVAGETYTLRPL
jgi:hypothetical protein